MIKNMKKSILSENLFVKLLDFNIIQHIFTETVIHNVVLEERKYKDKKKDKNFDNEDETNFIEDTYKSLFESFLSFSLTCKLFNQISKETKFEINFYEKEKIQNIPYSIYFKLKFLQQVITKQKKFYLPENGLNSKLLFLNYILLYVSDRGFYEVIKILIENGAQINYPYKYNDISLNFSCKSGLLKTTKELIKYGSNVNHLNDSKSIPLHYAVKTPNLNLVKYLIKKGSKINTQNDSEETALFCACYYGTLNIVKYLISLKEMKLDHQNCEKETILFDACGCTSENLELVQYLLDLGLNINHKDKYLRTCIFYSCNIQDLELTKLLILNGADLDIQYENKTLLQIEMEKQEPNQQLIEELKKHFFD